MSKRPPLIYINLNENLQSHSISTTFLLTLEQISDLYKSLAVFSTSLEDFPKSIFPIKMLAGAIKNLDTQEVVTKLRFLQKMEFNTKYYHLSKLFYLSTNI